MTDDLPGGFAEAVNGRCVFENIKCVVTLWMTLLAEAMAVGC